jgi:predicted rRNA methylase YqxC with S4 and FtsJ domains
MPSSTSFFKKETITYIVKNFPNDCKILDVGAGIGTYSDLLKPRGYKHIDAIEVFQPYIEQYDLKSKYENVYNDDITKSDIDFNKYDLVIFGDIIEHLSEEDALSVLNKIKSQTSVIVAVPFDAPQGEHFGNVHETHLQDKLTFDHFIKTYTNYIPFCVRYDYGIFLNINPVNIRQKIYTIDLPNKEEVLKDFVDKKIFEIDAPVELKKSPITIVTALWDLGRGNIEESFKRCYSDYQKKFSELLKTDVNMYIFADPKDEDFIWEHRSKDNTVLNLMSLDDLKNWFNFTKNTNEIRNDDKWLSQAGWLKNSPQATLEGYNPLVMSKMFMVNNVTIWNPFSSEYFFWIDAGITNTVHYGYFTHDKVFNNLPDFIGSNKDFLFLSYPYEGGSEVHGFERNALARYCNVDYVKYVCRGGFFGGKKSSINQINGLYYSYLDGSLKEGLMGTEESIFTILMHNHGDIITQYMIENNGLVWPFFEDLKNKNYNKNVINKSQNSAKNNLNINNTALYVITFNSPNQFKTLIQSMLEYDKNFIEKPKKFLLDNSTENSTFEEYEKLCKEYDFTHIKKDNLGICGGRQFIAEHASEMGFDFYFFFEDDMFLNPNKEYRCKNGFPSYVENLYENSLKISKNNSYDFLKLSFSEFYGDNITQWSWYNVPQNVRDKYWPNKTKLPVLGLDPNAPKTAFKNIGSFSKIPYIDGDIYYCNWPQLISKDGNVKMFLTEKWAHPFEQTWMSYIYQETMLGNIKPAILLLSVINHNRFDHYSSELRKES